MTDLCLLMKKGHTHKKEGGTVQPESHHLEITLTCILIYPSIVPSDHPSTHLSILSLFHSFMYLTRNHSFTWQILVIHLICFRHCFRCWRYRDVHTELLLFHLIIVLLIYNHGNLCFKIQHRYNVTVLSTLKINVI